jgi:hypothetical protein
MTTILTDDDKAEIWDAVNAFVVACGGDPDGNAFDDRKQQAAARINAALRGEDWEPCAITGCIERAAWEAWARVRDPFTMKPTGHLQKVTVCEEHKTHPWLCANEKKEANP